MEKKTAVLLATYNGARYIREQIESIYAQTYGDWMIYVHDDGSTDGTREILAEYAKEKNNFVVLDYPSQKGAANNFFSLLERVDADYYFFADQDDVWMNEKMSVCMKRMDSIETAKGDIPVLVCCDVMVADDDMNIISSSLWQYSGTHPEFLTNFNEAAASPFVTGCTMLINKRSKEVVEWNKVRYATMHDAFITLCVLKKNGVVSPVFESLMYYRQHGDNTLGAYSSSNNSMIYKLKHVSSLIKINLGLLRMLYALEYGSIFKFLKYKKIYKRRCKAADRC